MQFTEITIHTSTEGSELVADILWQYTVYGVAISDVKDVIALQQNKVMYWDYMDDSLTQNMSGDVLVKAFVTIADTPNVLPRIRADLEQLTANCAGVLPLGSLETTTRTIDGDEWVEVWKKHFRPIHIGSKVVVVPEWVKYDKADGEIIIRLDSNMAFGTGEHETTSMCLELLQKYGARGVCLDVGCGSGILGICAAQLGADSCILTDIDAVATDSALHNVKLNGVSGKCLVKRADLLGDLKIQADVALANITADILCRLAPDISLSVKSGGILILSGIIAEKLQGVKEVYRDNGFALKEQIVKGEWYALAFTKL